MSEKLPAWPEPDDYAQGISEEVRWQADRAEAAIARLKLAVEALRHQVAMIGECDCHEAYKGRKLTDPTCVACNYEVEDAMEALSAIGELPKE